MKKEDNRIFKILNNMECIFLIVMFIIMVLTSFLQVLNRNWFHLGLSWLEEVARFAMIYMVMLGTEMGLRDGTQIAVKGFVNLFKSKARFSLELIEKLIVIAFSLVVFIASFNLLALQVTSGQISPTLKIPMYVPYAAVTIGFGLTTIVQTALFIRLIIDRRNIIQGERRAES